MDWKNEICVDIFIATLSNLGWDENPQPQSVKFISILQELASPGSTNFLIYLHTSCGGAAISEERPISPFHLGQAGKWKQGSYGMWSHVA